MMSFQARWSLQGDVPWFGARTKRPVSTVKRVNHCQRQQQLETAERGHSRKEVPHQRTFASSFPSLFPCRRTEIGRLGDPHHLC